MISPNSGRVLQHIDGPAAVLDVAGDDPYTRMTLAHGAVGYRLRSAVGWLTSLPWQPSVLCLRGSPHETAELLDVLRDAEILPATTLLRAPLGSAPHSSFRARHLEDWLFLARDGELPLQPGESDVTELSVMSEVQDLLERSNPGSSAEPEGHGIRGWFGSYAGAQLVSCGADRSWNGVGYLAGITVDPAYRGHGLGSAVTAAMARALGTEYDSVALGVTVTNTAAIRLYQRLGFRAIEAISAYVLGGDRSSFG